MKMKIVLAALAACLLLPAAAQSPDTRPSAADAAQARDNARRDARLADAMEKARLKEEAKPASVYIPKPEAQKETPAPKHPEIFSAKVPGSGKKPAKKAPRKPKAPQPT